MNSFPGAMSSQLPDTFPAQMRSEGRLKLTKLAMSQNSQMAWVRTIIEGFPQVPPELRAGQGAGKNISGPEWETMEKMASTGKENYSKGGMNVLWMKGDTEVHGAIQQRVGQSDASHCSSIEQWSQWSDVNLQELLCVPGKYLGMDYENTACTEQPLTLLVTMRAD